jgi:hypothetical protein
VHSLILLLGGFALGFFALIPIALWNGHFSSQLALVGEVHVEWVVKGSNGKSPQKFGEEYREFLRELRESSVKKLLAKGLTIKEAEDAVRLAQWPEMVVGKRHSLEPRAVRFEASLSRVYNPAEVVSRLIRNREEGRHERPEPGLTRVEVGRLFVSHSFTDGSPNWRFDQPSYEIPNFDLLSFAGAPSAEALAWTLLKFAEHPTIQQTKAVVVLRCTEGGFATAEAVSAHYGDSLGRVTELGNFDPAELKLVSYPPARPWTAKSEPIVFSRYELADSDLRADRLRMLFTNRRVDQFAWIGLYSALTILAAYWTIRWRLGITRLVVRASVETHHRVRAVDTFMSQPPSKEEK